MTLAEQLIGKFINTRPDLIHTGEYKPIEIKKAVPSENVAAFIINDSYVLSYMDALKLVKES